MEEYPVNREKSLSKPWYITARLLCLKAAFVCPAPLWSSGRERDSRVQNAQQEQTLVILLQTISSHLANDEIPNLRQGSGSVLRQQLLQAGQAKFFVSGIGHFRYAVGKHQKQILRRIDDALTSIGTAGDQSQRKLLHGELGRVPAAVPIMEDRRMAGQRVFGRTGAIEAEQGQGGHTFHAP